MLLYMHASENATKKIKKTKQIQLAIGNFYIKKFSTSALHQMPEIRINPWFREIIASKQELLEVIK